MRVSDAATGRLRFNQQGMKYPHVWFKIPRSSRDDLFIRLLNDAVSVAGVLKRMR
jgi:hypothetical protein